MSTTLDPSGTCLRHCARAPARVQAAPDARPNRRNIIKRSPNRRSKNMTSLSPANAERLKLAFQECRDMEGTLNERLEAYAAAGREFFPAYGEAVNRLVRRIPPHVGAANAPPPPHPIPPP